MLTLSNYLDMQNLDMAGYIRIILCLIKIHTLY
jgi:hypothetical protein